MRFSQTFLEEIRTRLPAHSIIGKRVKLKRAGREWSGLSPFNKEKTPSFYVNDQKARWFDFSAGRNGDIFAFVQETEGVSFEESVTRLAGEAGLKLPDRDPEAIKREARKLSLIEIVEAADEFFRKCLKQSASAIAYLAGRGIGNETIDEFGIGFAPDDRSALKSFLAHEGIDQTEAIEAGLIIAGDDIPVSYDRFRNRIMFPIRDDRGRAIGFGGRDMSGTAKAKYVNSPETPIFDKGRTLYNLDKARDPAWSEAPCVVTEGYADTIASSRAGFSASVAPMGTSLTEYQLLGLWRLSDEPILCFDGDAAGQRAATRAVELALPKLQAGRSLRFALMPAGQDPDDVVRHRGGEAFASLVKKAVPLVDMLWRSAMSAPAATPEARAGLERSLMEAIDKIPDRDVQRNYRDDIRDRVKAIPARPAVYRSNGNSQHSASPGSIRLVHGAGNAPLILRDAMVIAAMVAAPAVAGASIEALACRKLTAQGKAVVDCLIGILADMPDAGTDALKTAAASNGIGPALEEAMSLCQSANLDFAFLAKTETATSILQG